MPAELSGQQLDGFQPLDGGETASTSVSSGRFDQCKNEEC